MVVSLFFLLFLFQSKHFLCDFVFQGPYQFRNKGNFKHPGGYVHALITVIGTAIALAIYYSMFSLPINWGLIFWILVGEFVAHYLIDWGKVNLNKLMKWEMTTCHEFWWLLGFDQFLHQMTYVFIFILLLA